MSLMHVLMQAAVAAAPVAEAQQGVTSYGPGFFAAQQPSTAVDMLNRIPGFTLDNGATVRGFEGAAGNVLIDGQRPASKNDTLQDILFRIPAGKVERIDIIRGGAPASTCRARPCWPTSSRRRTAASAASSPSPTTGRTTAATWARCASKGRARWGR